MLEPFQNYPDWMDRLNEELNTIYNKPTFKMPYSRQLRFEFFSSYFQKKSTTNMKAIFEDISKHLRKK